MVSPVAIVLQFFSGVFAVYSELPLWMQQIAMVISLRTFRWQMSSS